MSYSGARASQKPRGRFICLLAKAEKTDELPTVTTELLKDGIGYLKITEFDEITTDQFTEGLAELRASNIKGLIIDLRNNPGGNLMTV